MTGRDWYAWHDGYDDPGSVIARRLTAVQRAIVAALDRYPPGRITALSMCAGQGRDLVPRICAWYAAAGFELVSVSDPAEPFGLGVHRFAGHPRPLTRGARIFGDFRRTEPEQS